MVVLDNSVLVEIARKSVEGQALADLIVEDERVVCPAIIYAELISVFRKLVLQGKLAQEVVGAKATEALALIDEFYPLENLYTETLAEALRLQHSTYDMFYFVLARRLGATLFTLDGTLAKLCEEQGVDCVHKIEL